MFETKEELETYIYINFTPRNRDRAIDFYCENAGATAKEAAVAVDKIYAKRKNDGRELKEAWEWTPVCLVFLVTFLSVGIAGVRKMKKYDRKDKSGAVMAQSEVSVDTGSVW